MLLPLASAAAPAGPTASPVELEQLTWTELRDRVAGGATTALVPIGGTEQNGPHMVLGKHNVRVRVLAGRIAQQLGDALVAPVLAYVPEGRIDPPVAHMRWPGTISIPEAAFEALLDGTARSLCRHGFRDVVLLPDHGGYLKSLERVAARPGRPAGCRVHALTDYYRVTQEVYVDALKARGYTADEIGSHAGLADTALALAVDPSLVRGDRLGQPAGRSDGVVGDPRRASVELGRIGADQVVARSVAAIRALTRGK
ncbi:MAG: creatininase family protein [Piscinibacter sp.]|nr:creatininase family protein [Piscinibacter sp.]